MVPGHLCSCLCLGPSTANGKKEGNGREDVSRKSPGDLEGSAAQRCYSIERSRVHHPSWKDQLAEGWEAAESTGQRMYVSREARPPWNLPVSGRAPLMACPSLSASHFQNPQATQPVPNPMAACIRGTSDFGAPCFSGATEGQHISYEALVGAWHQACAVQGWLWGKELKILYPLKDLPNPLKPGSMAKTVGEIAFP